MTAVDGRVAIVTGTSSGLGTRFAQALDGAGARVVLASRRHDADVALAATLREALPVACDIRAPADRAHLVDTVLERHGRIDVLVNNAGVAYSGPAEDETPEQLADLVETNLTGLFALTQLVGRQMLDQGAGRSSTSPRRRPPSAWTATGWRATPPRRPAVVALTRELAAQWGARGVRVNALAPSWFPTATTGWLTDPDQVAWILAHTPLERLPRPDELDGPLLFLAGDASSYVTGQTLYVDGGWTCR